MPTTKKAEVPAENSSATDFDSNLCGLAMARLLGKAYKDTLQPGEYSVHATVTLRLSAELRKGESTVVTPTVDIPFTRLLAALASRMKLGKKKFLRNVLEEAKRVLTYRHLPEELVESEREIEGELAKLKKDLRLLLPKKKRSGALRVLGSVEIMQVTETISESVS